MFSDNFLYKVSEFFLQGADSAIIEVQIISIPFGENKKTFPNCIVA